MSVTLPWYKVWRSRSHAARWVNELNNVLDHLHSTGGAAVTAHSRIGHMPPLVRSIALASVALSERPSVVILEAADTMTSDTDATTLVTAVAAMAPPRTTIVFSTPQPLPAFAERPIIVLRLDETNESGNGTSLREHERTVSAAGALKGSNS